MKDKKNYLLTFISVLFSFYLCEFYLNFNDHFFYNSYQKKLNYFSIQKNNKPFDFRSSFKYLNDNKQEYPNAVLLTSPKFDDKNKILALAGISKKTNICCNELGYYMVYESDRYGFNNPDLVWKNKHIDYLLIGDSFVHGNSVNRPNDIASIMALEKKVINLGYPGTGPLHQLAVIKEYFLPSKKILWFFYEGNDLNELKEELNDNYLKKYLENDFKQELKFKQNLIDDYMLNEFNKFSNKILQEENANNQNKDKYIKLKQTLKIYKLRLFIKKIFQKEYEYKKISKINYNIDLYQNYEKILKKMKNFSFENNSELYLIYLPTVYRYEQNLDFEWTRLKIKKIAEKNNVNFIDLHSQFFKKQKEPAKYFSPTRPAHLNIIGYNQVSNLLMEIIENR